MKYIPLAEKDRQSLLKTIGVSSVEDLFDRIPSNLRLKDKLDYPRALSEQELRAHFGQLKDLSPSVKKSFAGCGIYSHDIPSIVPYLQGRTEFQTSYTPYQPEVSQGTLQAIFEFQTLACQLTETELSNATLYDGATSLGEALLMALRIKKRSQGKILISGALHPFYQEVLETYGDNFRDRFEILPLSGHETNLSQVSKRIDSGEVDVLITQSPNLFGCVEDYSSLGKIVEKSDCLWISSTMEALAFGAMRGPGAFGAHIVTAEGQSFGNAPFLGGSTYGIFCTKQDYVRNLPGRLVGQTTDQDSKRSFTLTFATREQFIRRGRATSNICTNNSLNMLAGLIHLATLGKEGITELANHNFSKSEYLKDGLRKAGLKVMTENSFNEFTIDLGKTPAKDLVSKAIQDSWVPGVDLGQFKKEWAHKLLVHASELHTRSDLDQLIEFLKAEAA